MANSIKCRITASLSRRDFVCRKPVFAKLRPGKPVCPGGKLPNVCMATAAAYAADVNVLLTDIQKLVLTQSMFKDGIDFGVSLILAVVLESYRLGRAFTDTDAAAPAIGWGNLGHPVFIDKRGSKGA